MLPEKAVVSERAALSSSLGANLTLNSLPSLSEDIWSGSVDGLDIVDYEPSNVALQLTNIDLELLKNIQPQVFISLTK